MLKKNLAISLFALISSPLLSHAADWQETNIQFLHGSDYRTFDDKSVSQMIVTLEHVDSWAYGSNYFFIDISNPDSDANASYYGEFSPAFSLSKMGLIEKPQGVLRDVAIQGNWEMPQGPAKRAVLGGLTFEWNIGFDYFATQFLYRDSFGGDGHTGQLTLVWLKKFGTEAWPFEFSGFLDWAGQEGDISDNLQTQPSLLYDASRRSSGKIPLKVGVEWQYWQNKYGIKGLTESLPQAKLVWIF
ncbi:DUF5020 family protein [Bdellovibrio sp. NC01]|uniref:DUF5020 family protein n=1 Tax=Bdellovibrio sp. NC01 TaxID=2220073 RepID=UPI00115B3331|nr:DUF5020 family protein [Bdellovibrio sp. NC01]QDK38994.1 DUF5020 domain-containing protein [Bdellovibrio sp. NC01]